MMLAAGSYSIFARATDLAGNMGAASSIRNFAVDVNRPSVLITSADPTVVLPSGVDAVAGSAEDDVRVERIELEATNRLTNIRYGPFLAACANCPGQAVAWTATIAVPPGTYRVQAFAVDAAGRRSLPREVMMIHL